MKWMRKIKGAVEPSATKTIRGALSPLYKMLARWLNKRTEKLSAGRKKLALIGICVLVGVYAIALIMGSIRYDLPAPINISKPSVYSDPISPNLIEAEKNIYRFHRYMDSLSASPVGIHQRDSILQAHPGIMDTIAMLEQLIQHHKK